jgi:hypothetical protein
MAFVCATGGAAHAQSQGVTGMVEPGAVFIYDDGRVERFVRADGDREVWASRRNQEYVRAANPVVPVLSWDFGGREGEAEVFGDADALWPPQEGSRARFRVQTVSKSDEDDTARSSVRAWACRVSKPEDVTTPAGTFEAWPIRCERYSLATMRLAEVRTWWWSDEVGQSVRRRFQSLDDGAAEDIRLCAALPPARASEARIDAVLSGCLKPAAES